MLSIINNKPLIVTIDNFISPEQCSNIVNFRWKWRKSKGWNAETSSTRFTDIRTSSTVFVNLKNITIPIEIRLIYTKISEFFNISSSRFEDVQLTRYEPNQFYQDHWDYFSDKDLQDNNRVITTILYLNDNFSGGNTTFPLLNQSIAPKAGKLLYFEYDYDKDTNKLTKHSGDQVISGIKQIATIWIRKIKWPP